jgi:hypothetical protein
LSQLLNSSDDRPVGRHQRLRGHEQRLQDLLHAEGAGQSRLSGPDFILAHDAIFFLDIYAFFKKNMAWFASL